MLAVTHLIFFKRSDDILGMLTTESGYVVTRIDIGIAGNSMATQTGGEFVFTGLGITCSLDSG
jgi:hypothetical protein